MKIRTILCYVLALAIAVIVYAVIPFYSLQGLAMVVWISGFAHSFLNSGGWPFFATNFGIPSPAPISFGLPGALLQSLLIHLFSLSAGDAYALGVVIWMAVSLGGCIRFARMLGAGPLTACFGSLIYLTLPLIWEHSGFSMLSFAFALLPLYLESAFRLIDSVDERSVFKICIRGLTFCVISFLAVFMDGYTYVMFFCATGAISLVALFRKSPPRFRLIAIAGPIVVLSAAASYVTYSAYEQGAPFSHESTDFFRGWGADILMLFIPSQGVSWLFDLLHLSLFRDPLQNFGDGSVWTTTFCAPLLIAGAVGFYLCKRNRLALPLLLISLLGLYLCLGPSIKFNSHRAPPGSDLDKDWPRMAGELAPIPTGSAFLDRNVPGFNFMRASYRWSGLLFAGLFGLSILLLKKLQETREGRFAATALISSLIAINIPNLPDRLSDGRHYRNSMLQLVSDIKPLNEAIGEGRRVAFYPQGNDFIVNYAAALGGYRTFNIGGDKNIEMAKANQPASVLSFFDAPLDEDFDQQIDRFLSSCDADCVVIPYFDLLWHAYDWPPDESTFLRLSAGGATLSRVSEKKERFAPLLRKLGSNPRFEVNTNPLFAIISLSVPCTPALMRSLAAGKNVLFKSAGTGLIYLKSGWSTPEPAGIWSNGKLASLSVFPDGVANNNLTLTIVSYAYLRPFFHSQEVEVRINKHLVKILTYTSASPVSNEIDVPQELLQIGEGLLNIEFTIKYPKSTWQLGSNRDNRKLGLNLISLSLNVQKH